MPVILYTYHIYIYSNWKHVIVRFITEDQIKTWKSNRFNHSLLEKCIHVSFLIQFNLCYECICILKLWIWFFTVERKVICEMLSKYGELNGNHILNQTQLSEADTISVTTECIPNLKKDIEINQGILL